MVQPEVRRRGTWRDVTSAVVVSCLSLAAVWWSARRSVAALGRPVDEGEVWACPAVYPPPPGCFPAWHVQVTALLSLVVVVALAGAVVVIRRYGRAVPVTVVVVVIALLVWMLAMHPTHYFPIW